MIPIEKSDEEKVSDFTEEYHKKVKNKLSDDEFNELNNLIFENFNDVKNYKGELVFKKEEIESNFYKLLNINYSELVKIKNKIDVSTKEYKIMERFNFKEKDIFSSEKLFKFIYRHFSKDSKLECEKWLNENKNKIRNSSFSIEKIVTTYQTNKILSKVQKKIEDKTITPNDLVEGLLSKFDKPKLYQETVLRSLDKHFKESFDRWLKYNTKKNIGIKELIELSTNKSNNFDENFEVHWSGELEISLFLKKYLVKKYGEAFGDVYRDLNKKKLVNITGVTVCPYCNRNFVNVTNEANTSQLDHFFPKSEYPLFALCFYNLIPSCYGCNNKKSDKHFNISPYDEAIGNIDELIKFSYKISNADFFTNKNSIEVILRPVSEVENDLFNDKKLLDLPNLYRLHNDVVQEILWKSSIYTKGYRDSIDKLLNPIPEVLRKIDNKMISKDKIIKYITDDDINRIVIGVYTTPKDFGKRPLSKMVTDISKEIGLIGGK